LANPIGRRRTMRFVRYSGFVSECQWNISGMSSNRAPARGEMGEAIACVNGE
jgi:hypothetical protein